MREYKISDLLCQPESQYFERKSARIKPKDILQHVIAFANAEGGILAIGIEDDGSLSENTSFLNHSLDDYRLAVLEGISPQPEIYYETIDQEINGIKHTIILLHIDVSTDAVIKSRNEDVYLRVGDKSVKQSFSKIKQLEYAKGERIFEDRILEDTSLADLDESLIEEYKNHIASSSHISTAQVLEARGFFKKGCLTVAGALLFAKNASLYLPQSRLRFLRYNGTKPETGVRLNIVKDQDFEGPIPHIIRQAKPAIAAQLREFQSLGSDGRFSIVPEYPEFAWFEGIVNALVHRDYSIRGDYVRVKMYDDRLEIFSPGALPNIVTLANMRYTRYSRNPRLARALTEFGWVRELNEGVNRIYDEMQDLYLKAPEYSEPHHQAVQLTLENNHIARQLRIDDRVSRLEELLEFEEFSENERKILSYLYSNEQINTQTAQRITKVSTVTARKILKSLVNKRAVAWHGNSVTDPKQYYTIIR